jgi:hypothetical protein
MNELSVTEEETMRGLLQLRWSHRRIARETGHHRATIQRVARAMAIAAASEAPRPATDAKVELLDELVVRGRLESFGDLACVKSECSQTRKALLTLATRFFAIV